VGIIQHPEATIQQTAQRVIMHQPEAILQQQAIIQRGIIQNTQAIIQQQAKKKQKIIQIRKHSLLNL